MTPDPSGAAVDVRDWRGTGQGPDMSLDVTRVFTMRKGKVFIIEEFWDHADALEAVGLSE